MSDTIFKRYIPAKGHQVNNLRVELYYSLGGMNFWTGKSEGRGYYLSVSPVERTTHNGYSTESYIAGAGIKELIKAVNRKSAKAAAEAETLVESRIQNLVNYVCGKYGVEVIEDDKS